jgi:hypothetical protein
MFATSRPEGVRQFREITGRALEQESAMSLNVNDELTINGVTYRVTPPPTAPGFFHSRTAAIYHILPAPAGNRVGGEGAALKVFHPPLRSPALLAQAEQLAAFAHLPGLQAARRTILTPAHHPDLLQRHPDLAFAALMPWIPGPTWQHILLAKRPLSPHQALTLARALAAALAGLEQHRLAHCALAGDHLLLPALAADDQPWPLHALVQLVALERMRGPDFPSPLAPPSDTHPQAAADPNADRFTGAVLLAEMLGWCRDAVVRAAWGASYFAPTELRQDCRRYQLLRQALEEQWGSSVAALLGQAWQSETPAECPSLTEWLEGLPEPRRSRPLFAQRPALPDKGAARQPDTAKVRALMQVAAYQEEQHDLETALKLYQQALALARSEPALASLAREIALTIEHVTRRLRVAPPAEQPAALATAAPSPQSGGRRVGWLGVGVIVGEFVTLGVMWLRQTMPAAPATPIELGVVGLLLAGAFALSFLLLESGDWRSRWLSVGVIVGGLVTLGGMWLGQTMPADPATPIELGVVGLLLAGAFALSFLLLESDWRSGWLSVGVIVGGLVTLGVVVVGGLVTLPAAPIEIVVGLGGAGLFLAWAVALSFLWLE